MIQENNSNFIGPWWLHKAIRTVDASTYLMVAFSGNTIAITDILHLHFQTDAYISDHSRCYAAITVSLASGVSPENS